VITRPWCQVGMAVVLGVISAVSQHVAAQSSTDVTSVERKSPIFVERAADSRERLAFWLETSLKRVFPTSPVGDSSALTLISARNARLSFQACYRNESTRAVTVDCSVTAPKGIETTIRRVGYVPMRNHTAQVPPEEQDGMGYIPGLVPDPLYPESQAVTGPNGTQSFWITLRIPSHVEPGIQRITVTMKPSDSGESIELPVDINLSHLVLQPRRDFPVTHWWNPDCIADWHQVELYGDRWFELAESYLHNMLDHGSNMIFVTLFHNRYEVVERPTQLLGVQRIGPDQYAFDWSKVRRFVRLAKRCGFQRFEWLHLWLMDIKPDGSIRSAARTIGIYEWTGGKAQLLFPRDYPATGESYTKFLKQFLPAFHQFLLEEDLLEASLFHVSDEPGGRPEDIENYRRVRSLLSELAPWTDGKVGDAMSDIRYGKMGLIDFPIPNVAAAKEYIDAGIPHWVYFCCGPRGAYLNRFFDTPLPKIRMSGWLYYRHRAQGFLHWGYNFWYVMDLGLNPKSQVLIDPFTDAAAGTTAGGEGEPYGDSFVVYPGPSGPIDSIRWEVFAESMQDYALLQTAGISPDDPLLQPLKDYADFPKSEEWITRAIKAILSAR
jgi:hypothetical protein